MSTHRQALHFVDADCTLGPYAIPLLPAGVDGSALSLIAKMDELGIAEACTASAVAMEYAPEVGNRQLSAEIRPFPRLHPVWMVGAHHTGEYPPPSLLCVQLAEHGVRMVKLVLHAGESYLHSFDPVLYQELLDLLAELRIPLHLDYYDFTDHDIRDLRETLRAWPALPIIITAPKIFKEERALYHLWEQFSNLYLTLSGYQLMGGIEETVKHFGARVLLYGSYFPYFTPLQSMLQLLYSDISEHDQRLIAGETILGLLRNAYPVMEAR